MSKQITLDEVAQHNKEGDMWVTIHGKVYDVSKFDKHPGTLAPLLKNAGTDATKNFDSVNHSDNAKNYMKEFEIGDLAEKKDTTSGKCDACCITSCCKWKLLILGGILAGAAVGGYLYYKKSDSSSK